ncbi:NCS2 family permease [Algoriphagus aestuariicola]|uniref:NCS2 family permease n=1 Tax=Algoriphagus aestuariicola TaxID=1852016 RepID=A0ABS3BYR2_9BACT|nr:NCS2 family permease [Algoriphagus aestuariicola]MBN7802859.1 NCS2 family permease [Algoriphagus aestuariicola]
MKASFKTEILAGISTFLACFYIIVVNPAILSQAGMPFPAVLTATVLVSAFGSLMMGLYAKNPIVVAPGMGINAFFTYTAVMGFGLSFEEALGAVFWSGVIFLLLSVFQTREKIIQAIPPAIRHAVSAGIGLFICFIGFQNAHFIVDNPATLVGMFSFRDPVTLTFLAGLLFTGSLLVRKVPGAIIFGILFTTALAWPIGRFWSDASAYNLGVSTLVNYTGFFAWPDFSLVGKADILGSLRFAHLPVIFVFTFTILFDGISTFVGLSEASGLKDPDGTPKNMRKSLLTDSLATLFAGLVGSSSGTAYIESAVGIEEGGRTGLTAVTAGLLFLPFMFFSPLLSVIPSIASSIALVLVGSFMVIPLTKINWHDPAEALPSFLTIVLIPFTYSLSVGISFGFISWTILKLLTGKTSELNPILAVISVLSLFFLWI